MKAAHQVWIDPFDQLYCARRRGRFDCGYPPQGSIMTFKHRVLASAAALILIGSIAPQAATASVNSQFSAAVSKVLKSIRSGQPALADMSDSEFNAFISCAQGVMNNAPTARKQYVLAASNLDEQRKRFDEVALDNRAELKQRITRECYY
jgi:hypothetical protein